MRLSVELLFVETIAIIAFQLFSLPRLVFAFKPAPGSRRAFRSHSRLHPLRALKFSTDSAESSPSDDDLSNWERMYQEGEAALTHLDIPIFAVASAAEMAKQGEMPAEFTIRSEIRVVTFDLDNTLWSTMGCINAANEALAAHLDADNIVQPKRVEKFMGDLFQAEKSKYAPLDAENAKAPVLLTQLRTDAIQKVLEDHNGYTREDALSYAENAFAIWTNARHDVIPNNFATSVVSCLEKLSSIRSSVGNHPVLIGAITDGNSDPRKVDVLRDYFDFCVNAEGVGVGKPDKRVYIEAIRYVAAHPSFQDLGIEDIENEEELENSVGPYWVHIGDDFIKDIVAAKSLKMRTIWATELIRDKLQKRNSEGDATDDQSATREVKDFVKEISEKNVVEMAIGADSYLADAMSKEFIDAVAEEFHHLSDILLGWHEEGNQIQQLFRDAEARNEPELSEALADLEKIAPKVEDKVTSMDAEILSVVLPDKPVRDEDAVNGARGSTNTETKPRAFRLEREAWTMDIPAPRLERETKTMKEVMTLAQLDKSSGVFSFPEEDVEALRKGNLVLMVKIGDTDLQFSREIFVKMTVQEVLSMTDINPVTITLYMKKAADSPSFDLF